MRYLRLPQVSPWALCIMLVVCCPGNASHAQQAQPLTPPDAAVQPLPPKTYVIHPQPQQAAVSLSPREGVAPLKVMVRRTPQSQVKSTVVAPMMWDFGDGSVVRGKNLRGATHTYTVPGTYTVRWCTDSMKLHVDSGNATPQTGCPASAPSAGTVVVRAQ